MQILITRIFYGLALFFLSISNLLSISREIPFAYWVSDWDYIFWRHGIAIFVQSGSVEYKKLIAFGETTLLYDVWRLGTNNPKCFTNTQKIALKAPSFKTPESYVNWSFYSAGDLRLFFETKYRSIYKY